MEINAYVDGSYNADTNEYGFGVYVELEDGKLSAAYLGKGLCKEGGRQVEGEVQAARLAIAIFAGEGDTLHIFYDYEGVEKWPTGQWKANKSYTKEYAEFFKSFQSGVDFTHAKGHTGIIGNEVADALAKAACNVYPTLANKKAVKDVGIKTNLAGYPVDSESVHVFTVTPGEIDKMVAQRLSNKENTGIER